MGSLSIGAGDGEGPGVPGARPTISTRGVRARHAGVSVGSRRDRASHYGAALYSSDPGPSPIRDRGPPPSVPMLISAPILYAPTLPDPPAPASFRVLDITMFHAPTGGGVRTYLEAKRQHLRARGIGHALVVPDRSDSVLVEGDSRTWRLRSPPVPGTPGYRLLVSPQGVERAVQSERPHVIEMGSPFLVPLLLRWATRHARPPVVGFYHSDLVRTYAVPGFGRFGPHARAAGVALAHRYIRDVYGRCDATVAASPAVARELEATGLENVHHVPLGVDLELFHPTRGRGRLSRLLGPGPDTPVGMFCGRLCPEKRLDVVLDARLRIPPGRRPRIVLVGTGQLEDMFRERARREEGLHLLPFESDRRRLAALLADADFYLAAGPGETFGLAVAESMACGLPVLAVDSGAVPDRVAGSGAAEPYPDGDVSGCADAMDRLVGRLGPELRRAARNHAEERFPWSATFDRLLSLYRELVRA